MILGVTLKTSGTIGGDQEKNHAEFLTLEF